MALVRLEYNYHSLFYNSTLFSINSTINQSTHNNQILNYPPPILHLTHNPLLNITIHHKITKIFKLSSIKNKNHPLQQDLWWLTHNPMSLIIFSIPIFNPSLIHLICFLINSLLIPLQEVIMALNFIIYKISTKITLKKFHNHVIHCRIGYLIMEFKEVLALVLEFFLLK